MSNVFGFVDKSPYWLYNNTPTAEYVTTNTEQTITGLKTFDSNLICNYTLYCSALNASSAIISPSLTTSFVYFPDGSIQTSAFTTSINVTSDNVNQFNYLTYVKTASTGSKQLYIDDISPVNLRYNPFSGELQASSLTTSSVYFPADGSTQTSAFPTSINISSDNVNQFNYLTYVKTASTGTKQVYIDDVSPVNLRYNPSTGELRASNYTLGDATTTQNGTLKFASGVYQLSNSANSGSYTFTCKDPSGVAGVALRIYSSQTISYGNVNLNSTDFNYRQFFGTYYNFMDLDTNEGGMYRARIFNYSPDSTTYLECNAGQNFGITIGGAYVFKTSTTETTVNKLVVGQPTTADKTTFTQTANLFEVKNEVASGITRFSALNASSVTQTPLTLTASSITTAGEVTFNPSALGAANVRNANAMPSIADNSNIVPTTAWVQSLFNSISIIPVGTILPYGGSSAPTGYLLCQGQLLLKTSYVALFAVIGDAYNIPYLNPDFFFLPDLRGVYPVMTGANYSSTQTASLVGANLQGPDLGKFQLQQTVFVQHNHTADYPANTSVANYAVPSAPDRSYYRSGAAQQNPTSNAVNGVSPNSYTTIGDILRPTSVGINYMIKY